MKSFVKVQLGLLGLSMLLPGICLALAQMENSDPYLLSNFALPTVLSCWILALITPLAWPGTTPRSTRLTAFVLMWSSIAIFFPLCWDLPWALFHDWVRGATAEDRVKWYFWAYAVADTRFLKSDPLMICVEYWSGVIGVIEIFFMITFLRGNLEKAYRLFLMAGCFQFYGCSIFFGMEALNGFVNIRPDMLSYIKFFGMNGMWVVTPAISGYFINQLLQERGYSVQATVQSLFNSASNPKNQNINAQFANRKAI